MCLLLHQIVIHFMPNTLGLEKDFFWLSISCQYFTLFKTKGKSFTQGEKNHAKSSTFFMLTTSTFPISFAILFTTIFKRRMLLLPKCCVDNSPQMRLWQKWFLWKNRKKNKRKHTTKERSFSRFYVALKPKSDIFEIFTCSSISTVFQMYFMLESVKLKTL